MMMVTTTASASILLIFLPPFLQATPFNAETGCITSILSSILNNDSTCAQIIAAYLDRIDRFNRKGPNIGAVIATLPNALNRAAQLDMEFKQTQTLKGQLHCVPVLVKDNIDVAGVPTTNGLNAFRDQVPQISADVVQNLESQGAVMIAKANMSPFADKEAWGNSETGGLIRNPFALDRTTYGSSGGNGAGGAAMFGVLGLGTETGVSVNLPSSAGNLFGLRAPVDTLSQEGVMPNSAFQDVVGPMAKRAEDVVTAYNAMKKAGGPNYVGGEVFASRALVGMKVNVFEMFTYGAFDVPGLGFYQVDPEILVLFGRMVENLQAAGAEVINKSIDFQSAMNPVMAMFMQTEKPCVKAFRDAYFGNSSRFAPGAPYHSVQDVVDSGKLPGNYQKVWQEVLEAAKDSTACDTAKRNFLKARKSLIDDFLTPLLEGADLAIWPAMPELPPRLKVDAYTRQWTSSINPPVNLILLGSWSAYPSLDVPLGFTEPKPAAPQGLPIGAFTITTPDKLGKLFRFAYGCQESGIVESKLPESVMANGGDSGSCGGKNGTAGSGGSAGSKSGGGGACDCCACSNNGGALSSVRVISLHSFLICLLTFTATFIALA